MSERQKENALKMSKLLKTLAQPIRLLIVCHLLEGELYAQEITDSLGTTKGNISQHLTALLNQEIIERISNGNRNLYAIKDPRIKKLVQLMKELYCPDFKLANPSKNHHKRRNL
ncbi:MAG: winged helix-turn-helix transcriptional regulator [Oligoflexia bacterium]|nr:winged helix-turn-helix transcriptional regulator [Oligoflexia bacterium]MBF0365578.1 winged helix-turn-helix transcriptional regulator [Oligoflexia bacterium]